MTYGALKVHVLVWLKRRLYAKTQGKYTEGNSTLLQLETLPPDKCHRCVYIHLRQYNNSTLQGKSPHPSSWAELRLALLSFPFFFLLCIVCVNSFRCRQSLSGKHANSNSYSCSIIPHTIHCSLLWMKAKAEENMYNSNINCIQRGFWQV